MFKTTNANTGAQKLFSKALLAMLVKNLPHRMFAQKKKLTNNSGKTLIFKYLDPLPVADTPMVEGVTPVGTTPVLNEISATVISYGDYISVSDEVDLFDEYGKVLASPNSAANVELLGEQATKTLDTLCRDVLSAGSNVYYSGAPTNVARIDVGAAHKVSEGDYEKIVRTLEINNVKRISPIMGASAGFNTTPVAASYIAYIGARTAYDVRKLTNFVGVHKYATPEDRLPYEIGSLPDIGIRFLESTNDRIFAGEGAAGIDVHCDIVFGKDAYGEIDLNNPKQSVQDGAIRQEGPILFIAKPQGSSGTEDPLNQRATFGWKVPAYVAKILRQVALMRYEHAVSD